MEATQHIEQIGLSDLPAFDSAEVLSTVSRTLDRNFILSNQWGECSAVGLSLIGGAVFAPGVALSRCFCRHAGINVVESLIEAAADLVYPGIRSCFSENLVFNGVDQLI